jgi:hypothetical protein
MAEKLLNGDFDQLGIYVRAMADEMGLRDWYLTLSHKEPEDDTHGAECDVTYGQKNATLFYRDDWPEWDADTLRRMTAHELIHCHVWAMEQRMCDLRASIGSMAYDIFAMAFRHDLELAVDGMARAWAETLTLPIRNEDR